MFTKYGYFTIGVATAISLIFIIAGIFIHNEYIKWLLFGLSAFILIFTLNFFRDPERVTPKEDGIIISPADGEVILIKDVIEDSFIKEESTQISIFMSPLNVHVNRIPLSGTVEYLRYVEGKYLVASHDKASSENERMEIGIQGEKSKVFFTQVSGYVARRIIADLSKGDSVKIGERFGMIKFGSRVDVIVPKIWNVNVKKGDMVKAGETILFRALEK